MTLEKHPQTLPLNKTSKKSVPSPSIRILLVDDDTLVREGFKAILKSVPGIKVVGEAGNMEEAIQQVMENKFDVVMMDIAFNHKHQPKSMDGIAATRRILEIDSRLEILAVSNLDEPNYINGIVEAGARGYILKMDDKEELINGIRSVHNGKAYYSRDISNILLEARMRRKKVSSRKTNYDLPPEQLTKREKEVLKLIVDEHTNQEIAEVLFINIRTVEAHRKNLMSKIGVKNAVGLAKYAFRHSLDEPEPDL